MNRTLIENLIEHHEGRKNSVYKDSLGNLSAGVGCLLMSDVNGELIANQRVVEIFNQLGIDFDAVCKGEISLTDQQVEDIFQIQLNDAIRDSQAQFLEFDSYPDAVQAVIVDMEFNLGAEKYAEFVDTIAAIKDRNWIKAAAEMRDSLWCGQVGNRCADDCKLMESAA